MKQLDFIKEEGYAFFDSNFSKKFEQQLHILPKNARKQLLATYREIFCSGWYSCAISSLNDFLSSDNKDSNPEDEANNV